MTDNKYKRYWVQLSSEDIDRIRNALRYYRWFVMNCGYWACEPKWDKAKIQYTMRHMDEILIDKPKEEEIIA